ncbi:MAG: aminoacyl-tRNA hydrolase [bacterium]|jgi:PTH1 family peptidyl-tRNA hydrolase
MVRWLIVGLGNPGREYAWSPHNIGFMAVDRLAERNGIVLDRREVRAVTGSGTVAGTPVLLAKPQTYMNLSGSSVRPLLEKYGLDASGLMVVYDDHDLPWTALRIRERGSAGGHNGMGDIIRSLGTEDFTRVRLGIRAGTGERAEPGFLLKPMRREWKEELDGFLDYAAQAVESIISEGVEKAMTRFNRRALGETSEAK